MADRLRIPGARDVRATLDSGDGERGGDNGADDDTERVVVACPPHPQMGGGRTDSRLRAVSDALADERIDCLRFDYGPWDEGRGERTDTEAALSWARDRYGSVGLFGYSFGGAVALLAAAEATAPPDAVSVLAPGAGITGDRDPVDALGRIDAPVQVIYGERDDTAEWEPIVDRAGETGRTVTEFQADHFFVGQQPRVAAAVASFFDAELPF